MDMLKTCVSACAAITLLCVGFYALCVIDAIWKKIRWGEKVKDNINIFKSLRELYEKGHKIGVVLFIIILAVGACYTVADHFFSTRELGAFLEERGEFEEEYEAYVYVDGKPVFCIVEIDKVMNVYEDGRGRTSYIITKIKLPYGKEQVDMDDEYRLGKKDNTVRLGVDMWKWYKIEVGSVATEKSRIILKNTVVTSYGNLCASKKSDKYHYLDCPSVAQIGDKNKIFFKSALEADALQYTFCSLCAER